MTLFSRVPVLSAGLLLAGCVIIQPVSYDNRAAYSFFTYAASDRDFRLTIFGDPFPDAQAKLEQVVTAAFQRAHPSVRANFTPRPGPSERKPFRAVVAFNPPVTMLPNQLCASQAVSYPIVTGEKLRVMMAFCTDRAEADILASITPAPAIDSAELASGLTDMAVQLIPAFVLEKNER
ncbi:MAG: hypothetical protein O3A84_17060 [Proteobacteria bacterium]|nr:hypothetical protein [Pseudomonadota bacterium]